MRPRLISLLEGKNIDNRDKKKENITEKQEFLYLING
jgi:hypothetical protein